jgi:hypothetical protein
MGLLGVCVSSSGGVQKKVRSHSRVSSAEDTSQAVNTRNDIGTAAKKRKTQGKQRVVATQRPASSVSRYYH